MVLRKFHELVENMLSSPSLVELMLSRKSGNLPGFLIYAPENSALRTFQAEGQILPLGIRGEGLFAHLKALTSAKNKKRLAKIMEELTLIDWFEGFDIPEGLASWRAEHPHSGSLPSQWGLFRPTECERRVPLPPLHHHPPHKRGYSVILLD